MPVGIRLLALDGADKQTVRFCLAFAAPAADAGAVGAPATLDMGDGQTADLGLICPPTVFTWREQRLLELVTHRYDGPGLFAARLRWGDVTADVVAPGIPAPDALAGAHPDLPLFGVEMREGRPLERTVKVAASGLAQGQQLWLDGGAGQAWLLTNGEGVTQPADRRLSYAKPGTYPVAVDLLDAGGFWAATLIEDKVEISAPPQEVPADVAASATPAGRYVAVADQLPVRELLASQPWLPFRYARPLWGWLRTYTSPGGSTVSRVLALGTNLSLHSETMVSGALWYQTAGGDWVPASQVDVMTPSDLRGVELNAPQAPPSTPPAPAPQPAPQPQPAAQRRAVVTSAILNVRAKPGVRADNPVIGQLRAGAEVTIYEETTNAGASWCRIGENRWVAGAYLRTVSAGGRVASAAEAEGVTGLSLPIGWVVAPNLNVRSKPGAGDDNPPIDQVVHNAALAILETQVLGGANWYRIGRDRWVEGGWVGVARLTKRPSAIRADEHWVAVSLREQTAVAYEGDRPVYAALISSGHAATPTPQGIFRTYRRLETGPMSGGSPSYGSYYYLEDVTWTEYFRSGYSLHTAYWHDAFGRPRSHGCINLSPYDAWWIYRWSAAGGDKSPAVHIYA